MLIPRHPRPVTRRRAVPEMSVAYKQAAAIEPGHVLQAALSAPMTNGLVASGEGNAKEPPICFSVVYRLPEYLAILRELLPRQMLQRETARGRTTTDRLSWSMRVSLRWLVPLVGTPVFLLKKRRMPVCRFTIAAEGIEREAGGDRLVVPWDEVVAVHRLPGAWVIDKGRGAMPVPHRCLGDAQRAAFERLILSRFPHDTPI